MNKGKSHKRAPSLTRALNNSIDPAVITQDTKLRLAKAAELAFPDGSIKANSLRSARC